MATQYDVIYFWTGNARNGSWAKMRGYSSEALEIIRTRGYHAVPGLESIGAPETPPTQQQIDAARTSADMTIIYSGDDGKLHVGKSLPDVMEDFFGPLCDEMVQSDTGQFAAHIASILCEALNAKSRKELIDRLDNEQMFPELLWAALSSLDDLLTKKGL